MEELLDPGYWRARAPSLHVEEEIVARPLVEATQALREELWNALLTDGYYRGEPLVDRETTRAMAAAVEELDTEGIPTVFAFAYDEFWRASTWFRAYLELALGPGFRMLPDFWAWRVAPASSGWPPHRDRNRDTSRSNGMPASLSIWVPLADATADNGCMYVLPACLDRALREGRLDDVTVERVQDVRALPARAGSFLCWSQALLHWSGRSRADASRPRLSFSIEYQRGDVAPFAEPLIDPARTPSLRERLALIGRQLRQYTHMTDLAPSVVTLGARLEALTSPR